MTAESAYVLHLPLVVGETAKVWAVDYQWVRRVDIRGETVHDAIGDIVEQIEAVLPEVSDTICLVLGELEQLGALEGDLARLQTVVIAGLGNGDSNSIGKDADC